MDLIHKILSAIVTPTVFEIGMHRGEHTRQLLSFCLSPEYYGFEPDPRNIETILRSDLPARIHFYPAAIGHITGPIDFHLSSPSPTGETASSSISEFTPELTRKWPWLTCSGTVKVYCWTLDDFCRAMEVNSIDFIWMDVQGAERLVFSGAKEMIPKTKYIWTEYDGGTLYKDSSTLSDIASMLNGFSLVHDTGSDALFKNQSP